MTSSRAVRTEDEAQLAMMPRYQVCGGWKTDWTQSYNIPTKYHLTTKDSDQTFYMFNFTYLHDYDVLLAEEYTVEIILPYGAHDIQVSIHLC